MTPIDKLIQESISHHGRLCPRQVLGVRIGLAGAENLRLDAPRADKRLLVIVETDGCFVSGIEAATGCTVGHRTLRLEDHGKVAATFVDVKTGQALRIAPRLDVRQRAYNYAPGETRRYFAQMHGYQVMPDEELLSVERIWLNFSVDDLISRPGIRVNCDNCGEEIINQRELNIETKTLCRTCAGYGYYHLTDRHNQPVPYPFSKLNHLMQPAVVER
jgi:formylmethanofuran dehydrogenase subunit E